jgi:hypothetical protein
MGNNRMKILGVVALGAVLALPAFVAISAGSQAADEAKVDERYRAFGVVMGTGPTGANTVFTIAITRWSTEAEREALLATLREQGHEKFTDLLRSKEEVGWARGQGRAAAANPMPSTRIHYSRLVEYDDGRRGIILVTNRPMGMREVARASRSVDYNVSMITITMPPGDDPTGTGQLYMGLKIKWDADNNRIAAELASSEPVRLTNVRRTR